MSSHVLVLGAGGRLGHMAAEAFRDAGWTVTSLVRPGRSARAPAGSEVVEIDARDHTAVSAAARGADVILHALNGIRLTMVDLGVGLSRQRQVFWYFAIGVGAVLFLAGAIPMFIYGILKHT